MIVEWGEPGEPGEPGGRDKQCLLEEEYARRISPVTRPGEVV